jgi:hypothetical protein
MKNAIPRFTMSSITVVMLMFPLVVRAQQAAESPKVATPATATAKDMRVGDPYPLGSCPITGDKLGSMGDPVVKNYDGREVRFCCKACPSKFEKELAKSVATLDETIVKDQRPLYPLKTSIVTGKDLPAQPYEFVYGNRLIRVGAESERSDFLKDASKHLGELDAAAVASQSKNYPLKTCPVSNDELGGSMGKPVDVIVGGRLVRLCCKACRKDLEKEPAKFIAMTDSARKSADSKPQSDSGNKDAHPDNKHGG